MIKFKIISLILQVLKGSELKNDLEIKIKFADNQIYTILVSDKRIKLFDYFNSKLKRWKNIELFDLKEFKKKSFEIVLELFRKDKILDLTEENLVDVISLIDFLGLNTEIYIKETEIFWYNLVLTTVDFILSAKKDLDDRNLSCLISRNSFILELFKKTVKYFRIDSSVEFFNKQVFIYLYRRQHHLKPYKVFIQSQEQAFKRPENFCDLKIFAWFSKALNIYLIFLSTKPSSMNIILFDKSNTLEDNSVDDRLTISLNILYDQCRPIWLILDNVNIQEEDFFNLSKFYTIQKLKIVNYPKNLCLKNFHMKILKELTFENVNCHIYNMFYLSNVKKLEILNFEKCLINDKIYEHEVSSSDINILNLNISNSKIGKSFFDWYGNLKKVRKLVLCDNIFYDESSLENFEYEFYEKLLHCINCCVSKRQIKYLISKKSLKEIELTCTEHGNKCKLKTEIRNNFVLTDVTIKCDSCFKDRENI